MYDLGPAPRRWLQGAMWVFFDDAEEAASIGSKTREEERKRRSASAEELVLAIAMGRDREREENFRMMILI